MNLTVKYTDATGIDIDQTHNLTRLAFTKHFAIAGQGYAPKLNKLLRTIAMFLHYSYYLKEKGFTNNHFSEPPIQLSDPTEKGQFSNLAGKAIADFLSKRIDKSKFTVNYEAAMRLEKMPLKGGRPDLLAFAGKSRFAIEAKGYSEGFGDMKKHKAQSKTGGLKVDFTVACVSYNLYKTVKCNYLDPANDNAPSNDDLLRALTRNYYKGLLQFLDERYFEYREIEIQGEKFYEVSLLYPGFENDFVGQNSYCPFLYYEILDYYNPQLILPKNIVDYSENGLSNESSPFLFENINNVNIYIDNDRVGLQIRGLR